jgi:ornithine carbamoyltransferase
LCGGGCRAAAGLQLSHASRPRRRLSDSHPAGSEDIQLGKNESLRDTARVLSRFNDGILARVYGHADIEGLCAEASVPVINALSDREHPLQGLADMLTMREAFGALRGLTVAWVGDGNNVCATLLSAAPAMGFDVQVATPPGYGVAPALLARATAAAAAAGTRIAVGADPRAALAGAHVVATDTWVSMGQEAEKAARQAAFAGFQVTERLAADAGAHPEWRFLHCLPRKPDEVDDEVFYSPRRSLVWDEAENRMWTVMAVLLAQMDGGAVVPA